MTRRSRLVAALVALLLTAGACSEITSSGGSSGAGPSGGTAAPGASSGCDRLAEAFGAVTADVVRIGTGGAQGAVEQFERDLDTLADLVEGPLRDEVRAWANAVRRYGERLSAAAAGTTIAPEDLSPLSIVDDPTLVETRKQIDEHIAQTCSTGTTRGTAR